MEERGMRLGIFGSYNAGSIGDHAILEGILAQFRSRDNKLTVLVFSFAPAATKQMLSSQKDVKITSASPRDRVVRSYPEHQQNYYNHPETGHFKFKFVSWFVKWQRNESPFIRLCQEIVQLILDLMLLWHISFWYKKLQEISQLDFLILGGGNILMDLSGSWPIYPLMYAVLAKLKHVPVMLYAVGAGPIRSLRAKCYFRLTSYLVDKITLRDEESMTIVREQLRCSENKLYLSADPAVCLQLSSKEILPGSKLHLIVGVTVVPFNHPTLWPYTHLDVYERYILAMAKVLGDIAEQFDARIVLFATNHPRDLTPAEDIVKKIRCKERIEIVEDRLSVSNILSLISSCDVLIGTRLHSLILSLVAGTPFLAFSYQPKVSAFCNRIGLGRYVLPLSDELGFSEREITILLQEILDREDDVKRKGQIGLQNLQKAAFLSCEVAKTLLARR
jgi:polysaccharide pyruvyl transferase WcaK-like protein